MKIVEISEVAPTCHSNFKLVETAEVSPTCHSNFKLVESTEVAPTEPAVARPPSLTLPL